MKKFTNFFALGLLIILFLGATFNADATYKRMVLVEEATNTSCGPCASQNPAFQKWVTDNFSSVVPVVYHASWPGDDDPMYLTDVTMNKQRVESYYQMNKVGVPNCRINGLIHTGMNGYYDGAPGDIPGITKELDKYKDATSYFQLTINEIRNGSTVTVEITVKADANLDNKKLRVVVNEAKITTETMPNGESEFFYVARKMLPDYKGTLVNLAPATTQKYTFNYNIPEEWNADALYITAFLQDETTHEVVQAAHNMSAASASFEAISNKYLKVDASSKITKTVTVKNPNDFVCSFDLSVDSQTSNIPSSWSVDLSKSEVTDLEPGATEDITMTVNASASAGLATINLKATPVTSKALKNDAYLAMYCLSNATKYAIYNANVGCANVLNDVMGYNDITVDSYAFIPFEVGAMQAYGKTWDAAFFCFNVNTMGILGGNSAYAAYTTEVYKVINDLLANNKKVFIQSEVDYTYAATVSKNTSVLNFFNNTLGLTYSGAKQFFNSSTNQFSLFQINGIAQDPISDGFAETQMNSGYNGTSWPFITYYADYFTVNSGSKSSPIFLHDNDKNKVAGIKYVNDKTKLVYLTFGLESIPGYQQRFDMGTKIVEYLLSDAAASLPTLKLSSNVVSFGKIKLNTKSTQTVTVTNEGAADLIITDISCDEFNDAYKIKDLPTATNPLTIKPNGSAVITIDFTPLEVKDYSDFLNFKSNAKTSPDVITIDGEGISEINTVKDFVSSDNKINLKVNPSLISETAEISINLTDLNNINLNLYDSNGNLAKTIANSCSDSKVQFDVSGLSSGKYFLIGNSGKSSAKVPVIIVK